MNFAEAEQRLMTSTGVALISERLNLNGYDIHYVKAGTGAPLLLLHGANIGWGGWYKNIAALAEHHTVYALDLPGCGDSTKVAFRNLDLKHAFVKTIQDFIARLDLKNIALVGHSIGGWIALSLVLHDPSRFRNMTLIDSIGFTKYIPWRFKPAAYYPLAALIAKTAIPPTRDGMREFITSVMFEKTAAEDVFIDYYYESVVRDFVTHPLMLINRLFGWTSFRDEFFLRPQFSKMQCPTLILAGDHDALVPYEKVADGFREISSAKSNIIKDTGHVPFLERPQIFNEILLRWLNEQH